MESYLCLDAVEATAPKHMAPPQLHLSVVDLIQVLHLLQLILRDLLLLRAVTRCLQELQPASGDTGHQLRRWTDTNVGPNISDTTAALPELNTSVKMLLRRFKRQLLMSNADVSHVLHFQSNESCSK